jgi:hypothetical protein
MSGRQPQASFKAGIEPEPIEVVAVRVAAVRSPTRSPHTIAERRDPSYVAHTVADILGARRLARRWVPAFDAASEENGPHRTRLGFSYAKQMAGGSWVGYLLSWGLPRSTLCSDNPEEECQQRLCFSWPKEEERREALKSSKVLRRNKQVIPLRGKVAL